MRQELDLQMSFVSQQRIIAVTFQFARMSSVSLLVHPLCHLCERGSQLPNELGLQVRSEESESHAACQGDTNKTKKLSRICASEVLLRHVSVLPSLPGLMQDLPGEAFSSVAQ